MTSTPFSQQLPRDVASTTVTQRYRGLSVMATTLSVSSRHAAAMELLQGGVDRAVIALWLGHESVETTQIYSAQRIVM